MMLLPSVILLLLAALVQAGKLTLDSPQIVITSSTGEKVRSESLSTLKKLPSPLALGATETLKLTFQVVDEEGGKGVQPHQTFLRFYDEKSGEEGIQPVRVTAGGKAKFELNMARPPASLPPSNAEPLKISLILGSYQHAPLKIDLFDLVVPPSHPPPQHPDEASFHLLPEIQHTFQLDPKLPPQIISAASAGLVLTPWLVLIPLWIQVKPRTTNVSSPSVLSFILTLGSFEALLLWYWLDLKLGQVLLYGTILSGPTVFFGSRALAFIGRKQQGKK